MEHLKVEAQQIEIHEYSIRCYDHQAFQDT